MDILRATNVARPWRRSATRGLTTAVLTACMVVGALPAEAARLTYDSANRLVRIDDGDVMTSYQYDGAGNIVGTCRFSLEGESTCSRLVINDQALYARIVAQIAEGGEEPDEIYAYGPQGVFAARQGDQALVPLADHAGSVRGWVDRESAEVIGRVAYDAFGRPRARVGTTPAIGYTGEWTSDSDALWLRARMYLPELGRFAQRDTFEGYRQDPVSLNRYTYAQNNPLRNVDPSGNVAITGAMVVGALALLLSTAFILNDTAVPAAAPRDQHDFQPDLNVWQKTAISTGVEVVGFGLGKFMVYAGRGLRRLGVAAWGRFYPFSSIVSDRAYARARYGPSAILKKAPRGLVSPPRQVFGDCVLCSIETIFRHAEVPVPVKPATARIRNAHSVIFAKDYGIDWATERKLLRKYYKNSKIRLSPTPKTLHGGRGSRVKAMNKILSTSHADDGVWQGLGIANKAGQDAHAIAVYQNQAMASAKGGAQMMIYDSAIGRFVQANVGEFVDTSNVISWTKATRIKPPMP